MRDKSGSWVGLTKVVFPTRETKRGKKRRKNGEGRE